MKNLPYLIALHSVEGLGSVRLKLLLDYFKDPKAVWDCSYKELKSLAVPEKVLTGISNKKKELSPELYWEELEREQIKILTFFDKDYPALLKEIPDPPLILYYKGEVKKSDSHSIGVVGTRKITSYGRVVTEQFTSGLVAAGLVIVSGLARGVDTIAHKTTLENEGRTLAILGGGLNLIFPPENIKLAAQIWDGRGAVMTEFPPNYPHLAGNFPGRNRIISGLSLGILVTEAAEDSGSLITARYASEQGREVFAIPGPVTSDLSRGPSILIKEGARLVYQVDDILDELGLDKDRRVADPAALDLSADDRVVLECLRNDTKHVDEVCRSLKKSSQLVTSSLIRLEIKGVVKSMGGGNYTSLLRKY